MVATFLKYKYSQSQYVKQLASLFHVHSHKIITISKVILEVTFIFSTEKNANKR